ncbi:MAG: substrate-binding domain-containing protein, partial [Actinomycetia bacterium]|nr:substrate-binding domain-containing protein [Actinomycetes bacterium]
MKNTRAAIAFMVASAMVLTLVLSGCDSLTSSFISDDNLTYDQAKEKLSALASRVKVTHTDPQPDNSWVGTEGSINELPAIDVKYPLSVVGNGQVDVEIFSSTEKSTKDASGWLDIQAKRFNNERRSVSIRPIASGSAVGYIATDTHIPAAYTPSNVLWAEMLKARGVSLDLVTDSMTKNTAGILMKPQTHQDFTAKYGQVTIENVVQAILNDDLILAQTDPNISSTGLNIMIQQLLTFDRSNPFSETSRAKMQELSNKIPPVSPTTAEMVKVASNGLADAIISEYQSWRSDPKLNDWKYTPVGLRHDSPLYAFNSHLSAEQKQVIEEFADFCATEEAQASATSLG